MRARRARRIGAALGMILLLMAGEAQATGVYTDCSCPLCEAAESFNHTQKMFGALGRGVVNTTLGWVELFVQPVKKAREDKTLFDGLISGVGETVKRTASGIWEIVTFWRAPDPAGYFVRDSARSCALGSLGLTGR
jgi:putative exosortase-associated protein (TIGR04073 family)